MLELHPMQLGKSRQIQLAIMLDQQLYTMTLSLLIPLW